MKDLWVNNKTFDEIQDIAELESDMVITNLHEDLLCLNEREKELECLLKLTEYNLGFILKHNKKLLVPPTLKYKEAI